MSSVRRLNRRTVLAARPQGLPRPEDFRLETSPLEGRNIGKHVVRVASG